MMVGHLGLDRSTERSGADGLLQMFDNLGMVQLDPLDRVGTNADLVAHARVDGVRRGDVYRTLLAGHAFEHFAKERCLLPAAVFPRYRDHSLQAPWWRLSERMKRLPEHLLDAVEAEIRERGPLTTRDLNDHGRTTPMDWSGWKGTGKLSSLAVEVLWTRCRLVCCGRTPRGKLWDVPERALPGVWNAHNEEQWTRAALMERVDSACMLPKALGPWWGQLRPHRDELVPRLLAEGSLVEVRVPASRRTWLVRPQTLETVWPDPDGRARVIGPLDQLLWDRALLRLAFDFEYVWEVYKPASKRRWGYYVCPILQGDRLVARFEAHREGDDLVLDNLWHEDDAGLDDDAWSACWRRLCAFQ
jgi:uncharacterized protein YcaQ